MWSCMSCPRDWSRRSPSLWYWTYLNHGPAPACWHGPRHQVGIWRSIPRSLSCTGFCRWHIGPVLPPNYRQNMYLLAINGFDPVTTTRVLEALNYSQVARATHDVDMCIAKHNNRPRTDIKVQRIMFNQVRFSPISKDPIPEHVACWAVTYLTKPDCPEHVGQIVRSPFRADFNVAYFKKMIKFTRLVHGAILLTILCWLLRPWYYPYDPHMLSSPQLQNRFGNSKYVLVRMEHEWLKASIMMSHMLHWPWLTASASSLTLEPHKENSIHPWHQDFFQNNIEFDSPKRTYNTSPPFVVE
jgi:hypothetical protein